MAGTSEIPTSSKRFDTHNPPRLSGNTDFTAVFEVLGTLAENPSLSAIIKRLRESPVK
jgi:hypothetical protein